MVLWNPYNIVLINYYYELLIFFLINCDYDNFLMIIYDTQCFYKTIVFFLDKIEPCSCLQGNLDDLNQISF